MTDKTKEALKLALEALEIATTPLAKDRQEVLRARTAIHEALAEQPAIKQDLTPEQPDMNLSCKSVQARLAASWGYVKAEQPAQPQQEPVAWRTRCTDPMRDWVLMYRHPKTEEQFSNMKIQPLYTSPPAQRTWVGLTDKEKREARNAVSYSPLAMTMGEWTEAVQDATEAKLKEKNA